MSAALSEFKRGTRASFGDALYFWVLWTLNYPGVGHISTRDLNVILISVTYNPNKELILQFLLGFQIP